MSIDGEIHKLLAEDYKKYRLVTVRPATPSLIGPPARRTLANLASLRT